MFSIITPSTVDAKARNKKEAARRKTASGIRIPDEMPDHAKHIFFETTTALIGRNNPRTGLPFSETDIRMIAWGAVKKKYERIGRKWVTRKTAKPEISKIPRKNF